MDKLNKCAGCGKPITERPFIRLKISEMLPLRGFAEHSQVLGTKAFHVGCWESAE